MKLDIIEMEVERWEWSQQVFPEATALSSLLKCEEEIDEIKADIRCGEAFAEEYADAIMCLFDSAARQGMSVFDILEAYAYKIEKNKARNWKKNEDNTYSHIKP